MTDIPADIEETADRIIAKAEGEDLRDYIIAVLMDERERCAQIAESITGIFNVADDIATAIRNPTTRRAAQ